MMSDNDAVRRAWKTADCVTFDVDSTVIVEEGIDELARFLGVGDEVTELTTSAMKGGMSFRAALTARLDIIRPSKDDIVQFLLKNPAKLTPGVERLVDALRKKGATVCLVSGGFHQLIDGIAEKAGIDKDNVFANTLLFNDDGTFAGFDVNEATSEDNGKAKVIGLLKRERGHRVVVHVGDGMTDADACPPADAFIGFGGNKQREAVMKRTTWFVTDFEELLLEL